MTDDIPRPRLSKEFEMMTDFMPLEEVKLGKFFAVLNDTVDWHDRCARMGDINRETIHGTLSWFIAVLRTVPKERLTEWPESIARLDQLVAKVFGDMKWETQAVHRNDLRNALNRFSWHMHVDIPYLRLEPALTEKIIMQDLYPGIVIK